MKKLLLLLLLFVGISTMGQGVYVNNRLKYPISDFTFTKDTTFTFDISTAYWWAFQPIWTGLDAANSYMLVEVSMYDTGENFVIVPDTLFMNSSSDTKLIQDRYGASIYDRIRLNFKHVTVTDGTIKLKGRLKTVK